jgi:lauroyl/myristoyl acyltransferase
MAPSNLFWRRLAYAGARYGPMPWLRYSPPLFGIAFGVALPEVRRTVLDNLRSILGKRNSVIEQLDILRTFTSYSRCLAESLAVERAEARLARTRTRGAEHLERALAAQGGLVIVTAHAGPWDSAARLLAEDHALEVVVAMAPETDLGARHLHDELRRRSGVRVVHVGKHPLDGLTLQHHVRRGGVVAIQLDRLPASGRGIEVTLFGQRRLVPLGPFVLGAHAAAPILPLFVRRCGFFDYELWAGPVIDLPRRPSAEALQAAAGQAAAAMERFIRAHPTQWFHFDGGK